MSKKSKPEKVKKEENKTKSNIFKTIFVDNIGYKLLAITVAAVMWVIIVGF